MKKLSVFAVQLLAAALLLTGCGSSDYEASASSVANYAVEGAGGVYDSVSMPMAIEESAAPEYEKSVEDRPEVSDTRKLIVTMNMEVQTTNLDEFGIRLLADVTALGGYIENENIYNGSGYPTNERNAGYVLRIPSDRLDGFITKLETESNIISKDRNVEDVTLSYVDLESHKKALLTEQDRLLEIMKKADNVTDLIAIEEQLTEVRYRLESMESQLRAYDNRIDYSTVYLNVREVTIYDSSFESTFFERVSTGFVNSIADICAGLRSFVEGLIIRSPYIVLYGFIIVAVIAVFRLIRRSGKKRRERRRAKQDDAEEMP